MPEKSKPLAVRLDMRPPLAIFIRDRGTAWNLCAKGAVERLLTEAMNRCKSQNVLAAIRRAKAE